MHPHQYRPASSGQWLQKHDLLNFIATLYEGDLHAKRVLSLANATLGVLTSASLAIHAVGRGLAQAMGTLTKHGVKQVDRLLSNRGLNVWTFFAYWTPFIVGARTEVVVALDWTSFAADGQDTIVLSMVTGHGRATPLLWKTVASSTLKGNQRRYEYEVLCRLREVLPAGVKVTVVADRGFTDCKLFYALTTELAFEYVIRLRGDIYVTNARGERRPAAGWVGAGGRARRLVGARVTDAYELPVGVVVCVHDPKMDEPWCLVASEATIPTRGLPLTTLRVIGSRRAYRLTSRVAATRPGHHSGRTPKSVERLERIRVDQNEIRALPDFDRAHLNVGLEELRGSERGECEDSPAVDPCRLEVGQLLVQGDAGNHKRIRRVRACQQGRTGYVKRSHEQQAVRPTCVDQRPIRGIHPVVLARRRRFPEAAASIFDIGHLGSCKPRVDRCARRNRPVGLHRCRDDPHSGVCQQRCGAGETVRVDRHSQVQLRPVPSVAER